MGVLDLAFARDDKARTGGGESATGFLLLVGGGGVGPVGFLLSGGGGILEVVLLGCGGTGGRCEGVFLLTASDVASVDLCIARVVLVQCTKCKHTIQANPKPDIHTS